MLTSGRDGTAKLWELSTGKYQQTNIMHMFCIILCGALKYLTIILLLTLFHLWGGGGAHCLCIPETTLIRGEGRTLLQA